MAVGKLSSNVPSFICCADADAIQPFIDSEPEKYLSTWTDVDTLIGFTSAVS